MVEKQDNVYYYLTLLNENYPMPGLQPGTEEQIIKGMYLLQGRRPSATASACSCWVRGTILRESHRRAGAARKDWGVGANVWSCPSFNELRPRRPGRRPLEPAAPGPRQPRVPFVAQQPSAAPARWSRRPTT